MVVPAPETGVDGAGGAADRGGAVHPGAGSDAEGLPSASSTCRLQLLPRSNRGSSCSRHSSDLGLITQV